MPLHIVARNKHLLNQLANSKKKHRISILKFSNNNLIKCICECVYNVLKGHVPINDQYKRRLSKHKLILRKLSKKKVSLKHKKKQIIQNGGAFLPALLIPLITGVLSTIFQ